MSVQNILNPATGQISNAYIDYDGAGVVRNPLTSNIDGATSFGLNDANLVSTGTLQADVIEAYSTLPGAPVAIVSNVKLQAPANQIDMETAGTNTIAAPAGSLELASDTGVRIASAPNLVGVAGTISLGDVTEHTGSGNQVQMLSDKGSQSITKYLKVYVGTTAYWLPMLSEDPVGNFQSPSYDVSQYAQPNPTELTFGWTAVPGAVSYKVYIRQGNSKSYMSEPEAAVPKDRYGNNWWTAEATVAAPTTTYTVDLSSTAKFNFLVYAYDAQGNRSAQPATQLFARYYGGTNIQTNIAPVYFYKVGNGAITFGDWLSGTGTLQVWNNQAQLNTNVTPQEVLFDQVGNQGPLGNFPQLTIWQDPVQAFFQFP